MDQLDTGSSRIRRRRITASESMTVSEDVKVGVNLGLFFGWSDPPRRLAIEVREIRPLIFNSNKQVQVSLLLISSQTGGTKLSLICCPSRVRTYWFTATDDYRVVTPPPSWTPRVPKPFGLWWIHSTVAPFGVYSEYLERYHSRSVGRMNACPVTPASSRSRGQLPLPPQT